MRKLCAFLMLPFAFVIALTAFAQTNAPAAAALTITDAHPGEIVNLVTTVAMPGVTNRFTNELRLPLALPAYPSNTVSIYRTYFAPPQNNFLIVFSAPKPFLNYTNCALFSSDTVNGHRHWLGSFPNEGQIIALVVTNRGSNEFFRAANIPGNTP